MYRVVLFLVANSEAIRLPTLKEIVGYQNNAYTATTSAIQLNLLSEGEGRDKENKAWNFVLSNLTENAKTTVDNNRVNDQISFKYIDLLGETFKEEDKLIYEQDKANQESGTEKRTDQMSAIKTEKRSRVFFRKYMSGTNKIEFESNSSNKKRKIRIDRVGLPTTTLIPTTMRGTPLSSLTSTQVSRGFYITKSYIKNFTKAILSFDKNETKMSTENVYTTEYDTSTPSQFANALSTTVSQLGSKSTTKPRLDSVRPTNIFVSQIVSHKTDYNSPFEKTMMDATSINVTDGKDKPVTLVSSFLRKNIGKEALETTVNSYPVKKQGGEDTIFTSTNAEATTVTETTTPRVISTVPSTLMSSLILEIPAAIATSMDSPLISNTLPSIMSTFVGSTTRKGLSVRNNQEKSDFVKNETSPALIITTQAPIVVSPIVTRSTTSTRQTITIMMDPTRMKPTSINRASTSCTERTHVNPKSIPTSVANKISTCLNGGLTCVTRTTNISRHLTVHHINNKKNNTLRSTDVPRKMHETINEMQTKVQENKTTTKLIRINISTPSAQMIFKKIHPYSRIQAQRNRQRLSAESINYEFGDKIAKKNFDNRRHTYLPERWEAKSVLEDIPATKKDEIRNITMYKGQYHKGNLPSIIAENISKDISLKEPKVEETTMISVNTGYISLPLETPAEHLKNPLDSLEDNTYQRSSSEVNHSKNTEPNKRIPEGHSPNRRRKPNVTAHTTRSLSIKLPSTLRPLPRNHPGDITLPPTTEQTDITLVEMIEESKELTQKRDQKIEMSDQNSRAQELAVTLAEPPSPEAAGTGRQPLRDFLRRKISTTIAPRTDSTTGRTTTIRRTTPLRNGHKPRAKDDRSVENVTTKSRRPAIIDYDYYVDEEEPVVRKSAVNEKLFLTNKGTIRCLDQGNFPHPYSCKKFITCARMVNGQVIGAEYTCPDKLSFDPVGGICNWSAGLGCKE
ncbi:hypothetical protein KM043_017574 [Ampulex compressa]|nr:hypothetical protein KM043_017574 [Ampulex compressa]